MRALREPWALAVLCFFTLPCWAISALLIYWLTVGNDPGLRPGIPQDARHAAEVHVATRGHPMHIWRAYCARHRVEGTASRVLQNGTAYHLPGISAVFEEGCHQTLISVEIPGAVPAGIYSYRFRVVVRTTPITTRVVEFPAILVRVLDPPRPPPHS